MIEFYLQNVQQQSKHIGVIINYFPLKHVKFHTFFGFLVNSTLLWKEHMNMFFSKLASDTFVHCRLPEFCNSTILLIVYYSLIVSHFRYGIILRGSAPETALRRLLVLQKKSPSVTYHLMLRDSSRSYFIGNKTLILLSYIREVALFVRFHEPPQICY